MAYSLARHNYLRDEQAYKQISRLSALELQGIKLSIICLSCPHRATYIDIHTSSYSPNTHRQFSELEV